PETRGLDMGESPQGDSQFTDVENVKQWGYEKWKAWVEAHGGWFGGLHTVNHVWGIYEDLALCGLYVSEMGPDSDNPLCAHCLKQLIRIIKRES
ncbi:MAG: hypothetical protein KKA68_21145, partial [Gammaproteobacteria bacterium]|nr:hypothetical protein [Gammaproteobacteria bacterium]